MAQRKFWSDLIFVQGINVLIKTIWILVIDRAVQDILPSEDYGTYYRLLSLSILFVIVLDLGLNSMNSREVAQNPSYMRANFKSYFTAKIVLSCLYITILFFTAYIFQFTEKQWFLLLGLAAFQIINSFNQYLRSNLAALHQFKMDGLLAVADRLLVIFVCGSWLVIPSLKAYLTIENFVFVQLGGVALTWVIAFSVNLSKIKTIEPIYVHPNVFRLIKHSLPYALLITLMAVFTRIDAVMIGEMLGDTQTDRYARCYRLIDAANMMAALFSGMLLPMFARMLTDSKAISNLAETATKVLIIPAIIVALIIAPHTADLLTLMYPNKTDIIPSDTFTLLGFSFIASASVFVFGTLLTAAAKLRTLNILALTAAATNVILNFILIPTQGIKGAALATLITQGIFAIGCLTYSYRSFDLKLQTKLVVKIILVLVVFASIFYGTMQFFNSSFVHIAFGVMLSALLVVGSGIINLNVLKNLKRRKTQNPSDN
ncbi:MAG: O-antigen/teichoic acid export membrane protein [Bacteroidia bacterium]|jgi:O-antigen/teichoic acid export membrane protein